ncbi:membrane dipeptidase [candidate division WOR-3 bacterium]|nr:membrane dipeptidase [candidate division WOR-3 bacterium]
MIRVFDLHCDTPFYLKKKKTRYIAPSRLFSEGYLGAVFAHFIYPKAKHPFVDAVRMIASTADYLTRAGNLHPVRRYRDIAQDRANILMGVEGGHIFDVTFYQVEALYGLGIRVFTLTWNNSNNLAHSALDNDQKGLTRAGRSYVRKLRKYRVILDLSHASTRTVLDVCETADNPVIASHSCVRSLHPSFLRNISDPAIKAICNRGGVVGVNVSKYHLGNAGVAEHIDYLCQKFSVRGAAIGSDFDGINDPVISGPPGIARVEKALRAMGYKNKDIQRIFSDNFLRVFRGI